MLRQWHLTEKQQKTDNFENYLELSDFKFDFQTNQLESLILAQDERWRRA